MAVKKDLAVKTKDSNRENREIRESRGQAVKYVKREKIQATSRCIDQQSKAHGTRQVCNNIACTDFGALCCCSHHLASVTAKKKKKRTFPSAFWKRKKDIDKDEFIDVEVGR